MSKYVWCVLAIVFVMAAVAVADDGSGVPVLESPERGDITVNVGDPHTFMVFFRQWFPEFYSRVDADGDGTIGNDEYDRAKGLCQKIMDSNPRIDVRDLVAEYMKQTAPPQTNKFWVRTIRLTGDDMPSVDMYASHIFSPKIGAFGYAYVSKGWAQWYGGGRFVPAPWCELELGAGLEQADDEYPWRVGSSLWVGNPKVSAIGFAEYGVGGFWHRAVGLYTLDGVVADFTSDIKVGLMSQSDLGIGPTGDVGIARTPLRVWIAALVDEFPNGKPTMLLSARAEF